MKKLLFVLLAVAVLSLGTACNNTDTPAKTDAVTTTENQDSSTRELQTNTEGDLSDIIDNGLDGMERGVRGAETLTDSEMRDAAR